MSRIPPLASWGGIPRERFKLGPRNFTCSSKASGSTNLPEMASPAPSGRLQNAIIDNRKVHKTGPKWKKAYNSEIVRDTAKIIVLQRQRHLTIYRVRNIGRVFELSGVAFRLVPPYGGLLVIIVCYMVSNAR